MSDRRESGVVAREVIDNRFSYMIEESVVVEWCVVDILWRLRVV